MLSVGVLGDAWAAAEADVRQAAVDPVRVAGEDYRAGSRWQLPATALAVSATVGT
jgi:hypothetical protein